MPRTVSVTLSVCRFLSMRLPVAFSETDSVFLLPAPSVVEADPTLIVWLRWWAVTTVVSVSVILQLPAA